MKDSGSSGSEAAEAWSKVVRSLMGLEGHVEDVLFFCTQKNAKEAHREGAALKWRIDHMMDVLEGIEQREG